MCSGRHLRRVFCAPGSVTGGCFVFHLISSRSKVLAGIGHSGAVPLDRCPHKTISSSNCPLRIRSRARFWQSPRLGLLLLACRWWSGLLSRRWLCRRIFLRRSFRCCGGLFVLRGLIHRQVFPHFLQPLWADAPDGLKVIHALKRAIGLSRLKDFVRSCGADAGHLLEFCRRGSVQVDGVQRRFLLGTEILRRPEHKDR